MMKMKSVAIKWLFDCEIKLEGIGIYEEVNLH